MAALSASQLMDLAKGAGFTGDDIATAAAVAQAESDGIPTKHNTTPPDNSYGLWQINMYGDLGPDRRKRFGLTSNDQLFDPKTNARVAYGIFKESGWNAWTTYKKGLLGPKVEEAPIEKAGDALDSVPAAISAFSASVFKGASNFAGIMIAIALLGAGIIFLIMSSNNAKKAVNVAANVIPGGSVVKQAAKKATSA